MKEKAYRIPVRAIGDFFEAPTVAMFVIDEASAREISKLASLVKENELHKVEKFDYRTHFYLHDPINNPDEAEEAGDDNEARTDCDCLNVSGTEFWFSAFVKNTEDIELITDRNQISELLDHFGIYAENQ